MPCRCDYMEPTNTERANRSKWHDDALKVADSIAYQNDIAREFLLGNVEKNPALDDSKHRAGAAALNGLSRLYGPTINADDRALAAEVEKQMKANETLRKYIAKGSLTEKQREKVEKDQIKHRQADLDRLMEVFGASHDSQRMRLVLAADITKPLEPQLGFSPDEF